MHLLDHRPCVCVLITFMGNGSVKLARLYCVELRVVCIYCGLACACCGSDAQGEHAYKRERERERERERVILYE